MKFYLIYNCESKQHLNNIVEFLFENVECCGKPQKMAEKFVCQ